MELESRERILEDFASHVGRGPQVLARGIEPPFVAGERAGSRIRELGGDRSLIDCAATGFPLGHRPPGPTGALRRALGELDCGDHLLLSRWRASLARRLAACLPGDIRTTVFCASGAEAVDLAVKIARGVTRRPKVVCFEGSDHGHTGFALAASSGAWAASAGPPAPGFVRVPFADAAALARAVDRDTAAVLLSPLDVPGGVRIPPDEFLAHVRGLCDAQGALWIDEEILTAPGRTGRLWAVDRQGLVPDILVIGRGLGGGVYPIAAASIREKHEALFRREPFLHVSTGGGTDLACVVASAVLDEVARPGFLDAVSRRSERLAGALGPVEARGGRLVGGVRARGLLVGIETRAPEMAARLSSEMAGRGVLARTAPLAPGVLVLAPPLTVTEDEVEEIVSTLDRSLAALEAGA